MPKIYVACEKINHIEQAVFITFNKKLLDVWYVNEVAYRKSLPYLRVRNSNHRALTYETYQVISGLTVATVPKDYKGELLFNFNYDLSKIDSDELSELVNIPTVYELDYNYKMSIDEICKFSIANHIRHSDDIIITNEFEDVCYMKEVNYNLLDMKTSVTYPLRVVRRTNRLDSVATKRVANLLQVCIYIDKPSNFYKACDSYMQKACKSSELYQNMNLDLGDLETLILTELDLAIEKCNELRE